MLENSFFKSNAFKNRVFLNLGGQRENRRSDRHETSLTPPTFKKKAVGRNRIGIRLPVIKICIKIAFSTHRLSKTNFCNLRGKNANRRSDSHEIWLTRLKHLKKVVGAHRIGIRLTVIQLCMKRPFSTHMLSKTIFLWFGVSKRKPLTR